MRNQAVKPDVPSMLVIYGFSLHLSHFSNNRSGGWGASNKHCALKKLPLVRGTPDIEMRRAGEFRDFGKMMFQVNKTLQIHQDSCPDPTVGCGCGNDGKGICDLFKKLHACPKPACSGLNQSHAKNPLKNTTSTF